MTVIPEKRQLEDHVHGAVASQFWSQCIQNSRSLTGQTCTAPCEPQPLRLNAPSGLSRTQFLVATRAVRVPVFPGYCDEHGGTVVDRVLLQHGGRNWWGAILGRAKLQRLIKERHNTRLRANLSHPDNYALAATGRLQLSKRTSLKATMQVDSLQQLQPLMPQGPRWLWQQQQPQHQQQQSREGRSSAQQLWQRHSWPKVCNNSSMSLQLKQQLEGLDVTADLALNEPSVEGVRRYCTTPLRLAVDLAPSSSSNSSSRHKDSWMKGLLFRVGLHGAVAPVEAAAAAAAGTSEQQQQQHALSVHCQGAIAMAGNKTLWEARKKPWQAAADAAQRQQKLIQQQRRQQQQQQQAAQLQVEPLVVDSKDSNGTTSSSSSSNNISSASHAATAGSSDAVPDSSSSSSSKSKPPRRSTGSSGRLSSRQPTTRSNGSSSSSSNGKKQYLTLMEEEIPLPLCNPATVQESLQEASSAIERLRTDIRSWHSRVESGELASFGSTSKPAAGLLDKEPGACWSSFLPAQHVKMSGLIGLLGRVPLQQQTLLSQGAQGTTTAQRSSSASLAGSEQAAADVDAGDSSARASAPSGRPLSHRARSFLAASATHLDRLVLGSAKKLSNSITQDSTLRLFASGAASVQLGEMRGNFFDYTKLEAAVDLGLNAPESTVAPAAAAAARPASGGSHRRRQQIKHRTSGIRAPSPRRGMETILGPAAAAAAPDLAAVQPPPLPSVDLPTAAASSSSQQQQGPAATPLRPHKHPAFALEDRSVWHALTVSATQQLIGPIRLRGDWRFALDSNKPCPQGAGWLQPSAPVQLLRHVAGISPAVVDSAVGVDVIVPGSSGLLRLLGWYSPGRKEGGLDLRLM